MKNMANLARYNLLNKFKKMGLGKIMFNRAIEQLKEKGFKKMILGCLEENPSNEFYKKMNGKFIKKNPIKIGKQELNENLYEYKI